MATVLDLVTEALVTVKALAVGEPVGSDMGNDALIRFNEVLESLSLQDLAVLTTTNTVVPLTAGVANYTIGPSGAVVAQRPPFVEVAFVTYNGVDFPVEVHTEDEYAAIGLKTQPGMPLWLIYEPNYPNGTITLWPVPERTASLTLYQNTAFTAATALTDTFDMPPGYRRMIRLLLAWELLSDYPGMSTKEIDKLDGDVKNAVALVKRNTKKPEMLRSEVADLDCSGGGGGSNWRTG